MVRNFGIGIGLALALFSGAAMAERNSIQLIGSAQPGCWNIEQIVNAVTRGAGSDREKVLALHKFGMAHFIHFDGPIEERGEYIADPMKLIAVYGYALCGNNSAAMNALYTAAGLKARRRSVPGHSIPEIWFEGKWNYIDTDMFGYVFLPDGHIASVDELSKNPELVTHQTHPPTPFYPFDTKESMANTFAHQNADKDYHPYSNAHLMNFSLRTGESARLYFRPQGAGRFFLTPAFRPDLGTEYKDYYLAGPVRKDSLAWCDRSPATYGNGLLEYAPDLRGEAFARENPESQNTAVAQRRNAPELVAKAAGTASFVVKVTTPWIISGLQNDLTDFDDQTDAAVVSGMFWRLAESDQNRILVSRDGGQTWTKVWENHYLGAVPFRVDLTKWTEGEYAYWVKFEWTDAKGGGREGIEKLKFRTWVELSPMALPRLAAGSNSFNLTSEPLRAVYSHSRWDRGQGLPGEQLQNLAVAQSTPYLRPVDRTKPGILTFPVPAEGEIRELRISIRARAAHGSQGDTVLLSLSEDDGATWRQAERFVPDPEHTFNAMWFNHVFRNQHLAGGHARVKIEVTGGSLDQVIANSVVAAPAAPTALRITHVWREGDQERMFSHVVPAGASSSSWEVTAAPGLINEEVRLEGVAQ